MDFTQLSADLESHPIEGWLNNGQHISIPLISHIKDNLYVGGFEGQGDLADFFSHVFSLYVFAGRYIHQGHHHEIKMFDSRLTDDDIIAVNRLADEIVAALDEGGNVLVHCQAGINRSNLAAGIALTKKYGMTGQEAIDLLRSQRSPHVLANKSYESYLRSI